MATTTTSNYGWVIPQNDELVKDGAAAIRTLGNSADTTVKSIADGRGLVHINTTSFSGSSSQSVNDVFSSTYSRYKFLFFISTSTGADINFRFRVSGADNSTSNYYYAGLSNGWSGASTSYYNSGSAQSLWKITSTGGGLYATGEFTILEPFSSANKHAIIGNWARGTGGDIFIGGVVFDAATSFTGFTIYPSTGTMTGNVTVLGIKN